MPPSPCVASGFSRKAAIVVCSSGWSRKPTHPNYFSLVASGLSRKINSRHQQRRGCNRAQRDAQLTRARHHAADRQRAEVQATAARQAHERRADGPVEAKIDGGHDLVAAEHRPARPGEELLQRHQALAGDAAREDDRAVGEQGRSCVGSGRRVQMLPASVARLRICTEPTTLAASTSAGNICRTCSLAMRSVIVQRPPIRSAESTCVMPDSSVSIRFKFTTTAGRMRPNRRRTSRSVPPASSVARAPDSCSVATAASTVLGRT